MEPAEVDRRAEFPRFCTGQQKPESVGCDTADANSAERELLDRPRQWGGRVFEPDPQQLGVFDEEGGEFATFDRGSEPTGLKVEMWEDHNGVGLESADDVEQGLPDRSQEAAGKERAAVGCGPAAIDKHEAAIMWSELCPDRVGDKRDDFFRAFHEAGESPEDGGTNFRDLGRVGE